MKRKMFSRICRLRWLGCSILLGAMLVATPSAAESDAARQAFDRLKALEGTWHGEAGPEGGPMEETTFVYEVTSAGHTVLERMFAGSGHEMVNVYWLQEGELVATHYCAGGNQPRFRRSAESSDRRLVLAFDGGSNLESVPGHIHDGWIEWQGDDRLRAQWNSRMGDEPAGSMRFELERE